MAGAGNILDPNNPSEPVTPDEFEHRPDYPERQEPVELPDFGFDDDLTLKSSAAAPAGLYDVLAAQRPAALPDEPTAPAYPDDGPTYRVSDATGELDLPAYELPPLAETGEMATDDKESGWKTTWAVVREVGETIILTLIIFLVIQMVVRNFRVVGTSMVNNLKDGQYLIIDKISYSPWLYETLGIGGPQRGDVVVFVPPRRPDEDYVKRIIAMPGEQVQVINGDVYINGEFYEESFQPQHGSYTMPEPVIVPEGQVFVLGDNRNNSNDSHNWGPLPIENIVGRALISYWPPDLWGTIPRDIPSEQATLKYYLEQVIPNANAKSE